MKYQSAEGMAYEEYKNLKESADEPVLFFCAGIWGNRHLTKVENVSLFLGVSKNAPNLSRKGDICRCKAEARNCLPMVTV